MKYAGVTRVYLNTDELREKLGVLPRTHNQFVKLNPTTRHFEKFRFSQGVDIDHDFPVVLARSPPRDPTAYLNISTFYAPPPVIDRTPADAEALWHVVSRRGPALRTPTKHTSLVSWDSNKRPPSESTSDLLPQRHYSDLSGEMENVEDEGEIFGDRALMIFQTRKRQRQG